MTIRLPYPPSVNALFTNRRGGRAKTKAYDMWIVEAGKELMIQRPEKHEGPVSISALVWLPDKRVRDLDNLWKSVLDLLCRHNVIGGDDWRFVYHLAITLQGIDKERAGVDLEVIPIPDFAQIAAMQKGGKTTAASYNQVPPAAGYEI